MKVKFFHLRNLDENERIEVKGGTTVAYQLNDQYQVVGFATAQCHRKDTYCKRTGRAKAGGRLKSNRYYKALNPPVTEQEFITALV